MAKPYRPIAFTRPVLAGFFAVISIAIAVAAAGRMNPTSSGPTGPILISRDLRFEDGADGSVIIREAGQERPIQILTGEQGFLRGTMRGLVRYRKAEGLGPEMPFRLTAWANGRLTIDDLATSRQLDLSAFGPMNTEVFGKLLTAQAPAQGLAQAPRGPTP